MKKIILISIFSFISIFSNAQRLSQVLIFGDTTGVNDVYVNDGRSILTIDKVNVIYFDSLGSSLTMSSGANWVGTNLSNSQLFASNGIHSARIINDPNSTLIYNDFVVKINCPSFMLAQDAVNSLEAVTFQQLQNYNKPHFVFTPVTGGTVNLVANAYNIINPSAASLASLTFHFPAMNNNDVIIIKSTKKIIALTITGQTIAYSIAPITIGTFIYLTYDASAGVLY